MPSSDSEIILKISGSGTTTALLEAIEPTFETDMPTHNLDVMDGVGTSEGVQGVLQGTLDIAAMARPPNSDEIVEYVELGKVGVAVVVHPTVEGITQLTTEQLIAIFSGKITNWAELNGPNETIILYVRDEKDSSTKNFRNTIFDDRPFSDTVANVLHSHGDMLLAIERTPYSIGFTTWVAALSLNSEIKAIAVDGVAPNEATYPMMNQLGIGYLAKQQTTIQPVIDWLLSEKGKQIRRNFGVIVE